MENTARTLPDFAGITLEKILESSNLNAALKKVESNKGAPGVDGMKTDELRQYITDHPGELRRVLLDGTYRPKPVKRVTIPKSEPGKFRELGIPTVCKIQPFPRRIPKFPWQPAQQRPKWHQFSEFVAQLVLHRLFLCPKKARNLAKWKAQTCPPADRALTFMSGP